MTNASRRMKKAEFELCQKNGVKDIVEIKVGIDGLTLAQSKAGPAIKLTLEQVFLALAEQVPDQDGKLVANPNKNWSDIDPSLPNVKIEVLGPPPTSGTRNSSMSCSWKRAPKTSLPKADEKSTTPRTSKRSGSRSARTAPTSRLVRTKRHRPETRGQQECLRHLRLLLPRGKRGQAQGCADRWREAGLRHHFVWQVQGRPPLFVYVKKRTSASCLASTSSLPSTFPPRPSSKDGYLARKGLVTLPKTEADKIMASAKRHEVLAATDVH